MRTTWALPPGRQLTHWTGASLAPTFSITSKLTAPAWSAWPAPMAEGLSARQGADGQGAALHLLAEALEFFVDPANVP